MDDRVIALVDQRWAITEATLTRLLVLSVISRNVDLGLLRRASGGRSRGSCHRER